MIDVPWTSPERVIIWSPGCSATWCRRRPVKAPFRTFEYLLFQWKTLFSLNQQFLCWSPKSPLKVPWRSWTLRTFRGSSGDVPGTSRDGWAVVKTQSWIEFQSLDVYLFLFEEPLKDFPFYSPIFLTVWLRYLQLRKKKISMYLSFQLFFKTTHKTLKC